MGIKLQDKVTNLEELDRAGLTSIEVMIMNGQLCWTGHVIRMDRSRLPRQLLYGALSQGHRTQGRPKKRYKDCIKDHLKHCDIPANELESCAKDRTAWRALTRKAFSNFESSRRDRITRARERRKAAMSAPAADSFQCPYCSRVCEDRPHQPHSGPPTKDAQ